MTKAGMAKQPVPEQQSNLFLAQGHTGFHWKFTVFPIGSLKILLGGTTFDANADTFLSTSFG
jgi:hypothetical protein